MIGTIVGDEDLSEPKETGTDKTRLYPFFAEPIPAADEKMDPDIPLGNDDDPKSKTAEPPKKVDSPKESDDLFESKSDK